MVSESIHLKVSHSFSRSASVKQETTPLVSQYRLPCARNITEVT